MTEKAATNEEVVYDEDGTIIQSSSAPDKEGEKTDKALASIVGELSEKSLGLLRTSALKLLAALHALHAAEYQELMDARTQGTGEEPPTTETSVPGPTPLHFKDRRADRVGVAGGPSLIDALNANPKVYVADLYESAPSSLEQTLSCHWQLREAISGSLTVRHPRTKAFHTLTTFERSAMLLGLRSFATLEEDLRFHGKPAIGGIMDMGLYAIHNGQDLRSSGIGICVALRDVQSVVEAEWWGKVAASIESKAGLGENNLRFSLVIDSAKALKRAESLAKALGARLLDIRLDSCGVALDHLSDGTPGSRNLLEGASKGTGYLGAAMTTLAALAHKLGVHAIWQGTDPKSATDLFSNAGIDGIACLSTDDSDEVLEAAEDAFSGEHQLEVKKKAGKLPALGKDGDWEGDIGALLEGALGACADAMTGVSRLYDLPVASLASAIQAGGVDEAPVRAAIRALRDSASETPNGPSVCAGLRKALRTTSRPSRLSDAIG
jgi:hypothetical protein